VTELDAVLDERLLFRDDPLVLYRLARRKYADTLSGQGSALYPGRWNEPGEQALYTSIEPAVCVLERLVHTPENRIPKDLALMKISVRGTWRNFDSETSKEVDSTAFFLHFSSLDIANSIVRPRHPFHSRATIAVAVPSVIVPVWNVVLYPGAASFWEHVSLLSVEPFDYDPRLFPEGTPWESEIG
jgi:RES domain-containing protein